MKENKMNEENLFTERYQKNREEWRTLVDEYMTSCIPVYENFDDAFSGDNEAPKFSHSKIGFTIPSNIAKGLSFWDWFLTTTHQRNISGIAPEIAKEVDRVNLEVAKSGIELCLRKAGVPSVFSNGKGVFTISALFGNSFVGLRMDETKGDFPIVCETIGVSNFFLNSTCDSVINSPSGKNADILGIVYERRKSQAEAEFGKFPEGTSWGFLKGTQDTYRDDNDQNDPYGEVCYVYDITDRSKPTMRVFVGSNATEYEDKRAEGKEYPFFLDNNPYLPIWHFQSIPDLQKFFSRGWGHFANNPHRLETALRNAEVYNRLRALTSPSIINVKDMEDAELSIAEANYRISQGQDGTMYNEIGADGRGNIERSVQLHQDGTTQGMGEIANWITSDAIAAGVNPFETRDTAKTAQQSNNEAQAVNKGIAYNSFINAGAWKHFLECFIQICTDTYSGEKYAKMPVETREIKLIEGAGDTVGAYSLKDAMTFLKAVKFTVRVVEFSGIAPNAQLEIQEMVLENQKLQVEQQNKILKGGGVPQQTQEQMQPLQQQ